MPSNEKYWTLTRKPGPKCWIFSLSCIHMYMNFVRPPLSDLKNQSRAGHQSFEKIANLICLISFLRLLSKFTWYWLNRLACNCAQNCSNMLWSLLSQFDSTHYFGTFSEEVTGSAQGHTDQRLNPRGFYFPRCANSWPKGRFSLILGRILGLVILIINIFTFLVLIFPRQRVHSCYFIRFLHVSPNRNSHASVLKRNF